jgi:cytochrome P450
VVSLQLLLICALVDDFCSSTAGAESTFSSATALLYVLANYPEIQAKAQAEIDAVIGSDRLALVKDREDLPYVHAIIKEVNRWHTVGPVG